MIMTLDRAGTVLFINRVMPGFDIRQVIGSNVFQYLPGEAQPIFRAAADRVFQTGEPAGYEAPGLGAHHQRAWYSVRMGPIKHGGETVAVTLVATDITERKRAEEALRQSEERYRRFFEEDLTGDYTAGADGSILTCNPAFASIFGFDSVAAAARGSLATLHPSFESYTVFLDALRAQRKLVYREMELRRLDGTPVFVIQNIIGTFDDAGELKEFTGYIFDITQHKKLEEHLRQALKMEAVGRLAGGIAHDFNNLLLAILGFSDVLQSQLPPGSPCHDDVREIQKAAERAAMLTRQLLAYSRKQVLQPQVLDLNVVVHDVSKMLRRMIGEDIELVAFTDPALGKVKADPGQIEQVIINLAVNARDAMPQGGRLTLRTANLQVTGPDTKRELEMRPGAYVMLSIADTGRGMTPDVKAHLFEPFFTTKDVGKGTGLGLSTVYGIVKQSGGEIEVESELNAGTTVRIYLPRIREPLAADPQAESTPRPLRGSETVLVVEDEGAVRALLRRILDRHGYKVLEAAHGPAALEFCSRYTDTIHVLIADLVMPEMNGRDLAERLLKLRPDLKVLYISGYTDDAMILRNRFPEAASFLSKPFAPDVLLRKVRQLLDSNVA